MSKRTPTIFNQVQDYDSLIQTLRNRLNWPIPDDGSEFKDLTYYWSPENLELDIMTQKRIVGCWQLRLFDLSFMGSHKPWGIFFIQFENNVQIDLSSTLLRRVLRGLVHRRGRSASLPSWPKDRVLFICTTVDFKNIGFAHFEGVNSPVFYGYPPIDNFRLGT